MNPIKQIFIIKFKRIFGITFFWIFTGFIFVLLELLYIAHFSEPINIDYSSEYNFRRQLITTLLFAGIAGLALGSFEVFYLHDKLRKKSFGYIVSAKIVFYVLAIVCMIILGSFFYHSYFTQKNIFHPEVIAGVKHNLFSPFFYASVLSWGLIIGVTHLFLQMSDNLGRGMLPKFILGKYHQPKEEERIFMFLDLKSSTTIAEKIGDKNYFNFIKDFFADVTDPIIFRKGEIYQYVGDELIIAWSLDKGIEKNNCLFAFFEIEDEINNLAGKYQKKYGIIPEFKAGLHCGKVIAGEVGILKTEIVYSGDVLNTTSRIQSECNKYNVKLLASEELIKRLIIDEQFSADIIGEIQLRGKELPVTLFAVERLAI